MTLKDDIRDVLNEYHVSGEYFAETVTYTPVGGASRDIDAYIEYEETIDLDSLETETRVVTARVSCQRHATNGIDLPNIGDQITRASTMDRDDRPFVFHGEIDNETRDHWRLMFTRKRRDAQGFR